MIARSRAARRAPSLAVALAVALVAALAGCATIPSTGAVQSTDPLSNTVQSDIEFLPAGPVAGSDQERIIRDFIDAGTGSQDNYAVAREYLTSTFAAKWDPRASVIVRQGSGIVAPVSGAQSTYTVQSAATVDSSGHYTESQPSTSTSLTFKFARVGGQWRLSYAPAGIVLSTANFDLVFRPHAVYFFDPTYTYLVPDERWFLARTSTTTRIAEAVLAGPSTWLRGAVVSAFPEGTGLSLNSVTTSSGTAHVDLTGDALSADSAQRSRMRAQLVASFSTVATVSSVDISVEGTALSIPESTGSVAIRNPTVDARPLVISKGTFGFATPSTVTPIAGLTKTVTALKPTSVELSTRQNAAAVGTPQGVFAVREGAAARRVDARSDLVDPAYDDAGFVWSAQATAPRSLTAYSLDGTPHRLTTSLPADEQLVAFRLSRDGARIALLFDADGTPRLLVAAVIRDGNHVPTGLGDPLELTPPTGTPVGLTWVDEITVATLSSNEAGDSLVSEHVVGGETSDLGRPSNTGVSIVGGNGVDRVSVMTAAGALLQPRGNGWEDTGVSADLLATQR
ncbi:Lipoprotein LpqB [Frondihabitans sp. 762G35]|uniref:GerMN domain-containing protein n=1 Tax=Frondihabitans sp. 762G35 TaxID=1446794 RepID=UPI000D225776|nr:GerMN domain-containing protein [Frondihabitans sp. 762G35]ARC57398.1 Lipoprotein LpqB [Frondihabitans sp. 762G35]